MRFLKFKRLLYISTYWGTLRTRFSIRTANHTYPSFSVSLLKFPVFIKLSVQFPGRNHCKNLSPQKAASPFSEYAFPLVARKISTF